VQLETIIKLFAPGLVGTLECARSLDILVFLNINRT